VGEHIVRDFGLPKDLEGAGKLMGIYNAIFSSYDIKSEVQGDSVITVLNDCTHWDQSDETKRCALRRKLLPRDPLRAEGCRELPRQHAGEPPLRRLALRFQLFASAGAVAVVSDRDGGAAQSVADGIIEAGGEAVAIPCDVTDEDDLERMLALTVDRFGGVDVLVNSAGSGGPKPFDMPIWDFEWAHRLNVFALFRLTQLCAPHMGTRSSHGRRAARALNWQVLAECRSVDETVAGHGQIHALTAASIMFAADACNRVLNRALQVHGGSGYIWETEIKRLFRSIKLMEIGAGTTEVCKMIIAGELLR
jgi:hypothetical protein